MSDNMGQTGHDGKEPVVFERGGKLFANSRDVAACFERRHSDVLRAIEGLGCSREFTERNFAFSTYIDGTGRSLPCCDMTKDGFAFLVMGFTGSKAAEFKERYIDRFNAMESALKNRAAGFSIPTTLSEALRLAADQADTIEKQKLVVLEQRQVIEAQTETVAAYDRIANAEGNCNLTLAAKELKVPPHTFTKWCDLNGWTYKRSNQRLAYQDKINAGYLDMKTDTVQRPDGTDKAVYQVYVTPKGLTRLAKIFTQTPPAAPLKPSPARSNNSNYQPGAGV